MKKILCLLIIIGIGASYYLYGGKGTLEVLTVEGPRSVVEASEGTVYGGVGTPSEQDVARKMAQFLQQNPLTLQKLKAAETESAERSPIAQSLEKSILNLKSSNGQSIDLHQYESTLNELKDLLNRTDPSDIRARRELLELSHQLDQTYSSEASVRLLQDQAYRNLASDNPALKQLGQEAFQLYINTEADPDQREEKIRQATIQMGFNPLGYSNAPVMQPPQGLQPNADPESW